MSESGQRKNVVKALKPLHGIPVENPVRPGTPDVNYIGGWIELKWLRRWPAREDTPLKIHHFTIQQRRWLRDRWAKGGASWLLLQIRRDWLLFTGPVAYEYVGHVNKEDLIKLAHRHWASGLPNKELIRCLTMDLGNWNGLPDLKHSSSKDAD